MKEKNLLDELMIELSKYGIPIRLNSGSAWNGFIRFNSVYGTILTNIRAIKLCPAGTPDICFLADKGRTFWIETKTLKGKQRKSQIAFQEAIEKLGHKYILTKDKNFIKMFDIYQTKE